MCKATKEHTDGQEDSNLSQEDIEDVVSISSEGWQQVSTPQIVQVLDCVHALASNVRNKQVHSACIQSEKHASCTRLLYRGRKHDVCTRPCVTLAQCMHRGRKHNVFAQVLVWESVQPRLGKTRKHTPHELPFHVRCAPRPGALRVPNKKESFCFSFNVSLK